MIILSTQTKPQVRRLRQNGHKKSSSILLSMPIVYLFGEFLLLDVVLAQLTGFVHCICYDLSPLALTKCLSVI